MLNVLAAGLLAGLLLVPPALIFSGTADKLPSIAEEHFDLSTNETHRFYITRFALEHIAERPLFGHGFDSSRAIPGGKIEEFTNAPALPLHPHNAVLQIWLELGAVGAVIAGAIVVFVFGGMRAFLNDRATAASANSAFTAFVTIALLSYGIWQNWWLMTAWLAAMLVAVAARTEPSADQLGR